MNNCFALIKAIDAYIEKNDKDLADAFNEAGFANPEDTVKEISSLEKKITEVLTAETTYIVSTLSRAKDFTNLYYGGINEQSSLWDEIKNGDTTAEELAVIFGDEFMAYIPELAGEYIKQTDPDLSISTITERTNSWINVWSITLGLIMAFNFHRDVEKNITDAIVNGINISMFVQNIKDKPIRDDYYNARLVSMTEILRAHSVAQQEAIMQNPAVEYKEWVHAGVFQTKPRENHVAMNGVTARKDETFTLIGADGAIYYPMYPRDSVLPPGESISCHCMHKGTINENILGLSLEERKRLQEEAIAADNEIFKNDHATYKTETGIDDNIAALDWFKQQTKNEQIAYLGDKSKWALYESGLIKDDAMLKIIKEKNLTELRNYGIITIDNKTIEHAAIGDFTNVRNPKLPAGGKNGGRPDGGGHGQSGIDELYKRGFEPNIVTTYANGVRIGNIPDHTDKLKQAKTTGQTWFPETWTDEDIRIAGTYIANTSQSTDKFRFGQYNGVRIGIVIDNDTVKTIFPDKIQ